MIDLKQTIKDYPFFARIIKWLQKPKKFKSAYRTKQWEKFNPQECITIEKCGDSYRLDVELNRSERSNRVFDYVLVDYKPNAPRGLKYCITIYFTYARSHRNGDVNSIFDIYRESNEIDALESIQRYCYKFMG